MSPPRLLSAGLLACALAAPAAASELTLPEVHERTLDNGLRVLVVPDHDIPNVALYVFWKVGSRNEQTGATGLAHYFEHMMFTGGARYGAAFDTTMEAAGGSNNAYTSRDVTVYQDWFPASALPLVLDMEADRMSGMVFDPDVVESERGVVQGEWRLYREDPGERLLELLWATAYVAHPYRWDVLGWKDDIDRWTQADLEDFFRRHYAPEHAVVVLAGDVEPAATLALVTEKLGRIPRGPGRREPHTREPPQQGERRVVLRDAQAALPQVLIAWHVPETAHPDTAALEVLEHVLAAGESSRLHVRLVETDTVCLEVGAGLQGPQFDPSLFTVQCVLREGGDPAVVERIVHGELVRLAAEGPREAELLKARNGLRAALLARLRTNDGRAELLGETELFHGGWRRVADRLAALRAVSAEDVRRVVAAYLHADNRTVATLVVGEPAE